MYTTKAIKYDILYCHGGKTDSFILSFIRIMQEAKISKEQKVDS